MRGRGLKPSAARPGVTVWAFAGNRWVEAEIAGEPWQRNDGIWVVTLRMPSGDHRSAWLLNLRPRPVMEQLKLNLPLGFA